MICYTVSFGIFVHFEGSCLPVKMVAWHNVLAYLERIIRTKMTKACMYHQTAVLRDFYYYRMGTV